MSQISKSRPNRQATKLVVALVAAFALAGCGGGGSENTVLDKAGVALYTSAGETVSVAQDAAVEYNIGGGGGTSKFVTYSASSSDVKIATVQVTGAKLTIKGIAGGETTVAVQDSAGATVQIKVKVPQAVVGKFAVNAPEKISLSPGLTSQYKINGGVAPYTVVASAPGVLSASAGKDSVSVTAGKAGSATLTVYDATGASLSFQVTVEESNIVAGKFVVNAPEKITLTPGLSAQYKITGGVAPYDVAVSAPNVIAASTGKDAVSVTAANPGTATLLVYDATGTATSFEVTVTGSDAIRVPLYTTAPDTIGMAAFEVGKYSVNGGTAPYVVTSSDVGFIKGAISGNDLTITSSGPAGRGVINIRDAAGVLLAVTVNVYGETPTGLYTTAPTGLTIGAGGLSTYSIKGGVAPYVASSSNTEVASASVANGNALQIRGVTAGVADILVFDATGKSVKVSATVGGGTGIVPLYTTAPESITVLVGATPSYKLAGGAAPYTVTSSNVDVATVTQTATSFTVTGKKAGLAVVSVRDANGTAVNIDVDVR